MIFAMQLVLAAAAVIYIDRSQPDRLVRLTYSLLVLYTVYSALICALSFLAPRFFPLGKLGGARVYADNDRTVVAVRIPL
jgi:hypothetical protein